MWSVWKIILYLSITITIPWNSSIRITFECCSLILDINVVYWFWYKCSIWILYTFIHVYLKIHLYIIHVYIRILFFRYCLFLLAAMVCAIAQFIMPILNYDDIYMSQMSQINFPKNNIFLEKLWRRDRPWTRSLTCKALAALHLNSSKKIECDRHTHARQFANYEDRWRC